MEDIDKIFLTELANLVEKYDAHFYYTRHDDGIHIQTGDKADCFVGFDLDPNELRRVAAPNAQGKPPAVGGSA